MPKFIIEIFSPDVNFSKEEIFKVIDDHYNQKVNGFQISAMRGWIKVEDYKEAI